jgi:RNA polymerase sigma factor (sigma-70 family)
MEKTLEIEDIIRKAMAEKPPALDTEEELLAYYRGFLAGVGRREGESERFEHYRDIVFRIAAELDRRFRGLSSSHRMEYEEFVSIGYEAVLELLRKQGAPDRQLAARAIRMRIKDAYRSRFLVRKMVKGEVSSRYAPIHQTGEMADDGDPPRILDNVVSGQDLTVEGEILWDAVRSRIEERRGFSGWRPDQLASVIQGRIQGKTLKEIGVEMGVSESRVCQILKEAAGWMEEKILPLVEVA